MVNSYRHPEPFFEILLRDRSRIFGRFRLIRHAVELHNCPAAELHLVQRVKYSRQVHLALTEFDPAVRTPSGIRLGRRWFDILYMEEKQAIRMFLNCRGGIPTSLKIMRHIELKLCIARIGGVAQPLQSIRLL